MKRFYLLFILLTGCAKEIKRLDIDPAIYPYYMAFIKAGQDRGQDWSTNNLTIKFGELPSSRVGQCYKATVRNTRFLTIGEEYQELREVTIQASWWDKASDSDRRLTINHELGHCMLGLGHDARMVGGYPESIMFPYHFGTWYAMHESVYLDQLFGLRRGAISGKPSETYMVEEPQHDEKACDFHIESI